MLPMMPGPMPGPMPPQPGGPMMPPPMGGPSPMDPETMKQLELIRLLEARQDDGLPVGTTMPQPFVPPSANGTRRGGA